MMPNVTRAEVGGEHDFELLFRRDGPGVWRTIYAFTGGRRHVAEEAVAEAFARAIAHAGGIRDPVPWIYRTAFRLAGEELRRERHHAPAEDSTVDPPEIGTLMRAMRRLSPSQRAAIVLRFEEGYSVEEVAHRMGMAAPTVRVHIHRGRKRLREILGSEDD